MTVTEKLYNAKQIEQRNKEREMSWKEIVSRIACTNENYMYLIIIGYITENGEKRTKAWKNTSVGRAIIQHENWCKKWGYSATIVKAVY